MRVGAVEVEGALVLAEVGGVVGLVDHQALHHRAEAGDHRAPAVGHHLLQHLGLDLQVPGVVELAGRQHRARGGGGIAAALEGDGGEGGLAGLAVALVGREDDHVVGAELVDPEGAGADGAEILLRAGLRPGAGAVFELRLLQDGRGGADEGPVGEGLGDAEADAHGVVVQRLDAGDIREAGQRIAAHLLVQAVVGGEHHVSGGERRAVGPHDVLPERPGDGHEVGRHAAVLDRGDVGGERGDHGPRIVVAGQRLEHEGGRLDVLGAAGEVGIDGRDRLPVEDLQVAVAAALGLGRGREHRHRERRDGETSHAFSEHVALLQSGGLGRAPFGTPRIICHHSAR